MSSPARGTVILGLDPRIQSNSAEPFDLSYSVPGYAPPSSTTFCPVM